MAYRKTEKVLAHLGAMRASIVGSAIDVISRTSLECLTTDAVAARADMSVGNIYRYFADKDELIAAVVATVLARDLAAMRAAAIACPGPIEKLASGICVFSRRMVANRRTMVAIGALPAYREGIKDEFEALIEVAGAAGTPRILAGVVTGAVFEVSGYLRPKDEPGLTRALLRAIGVPVEAEAERYSIPA